MQPVPDSRGREFAAVIATYISRTSPLNEQPGKYVDDTRMPPAPPGDTGQAFPRILVNNVQPADPPPVGQLVLDKIIAPDLVPVFGPQPDTGTVV